MNTVNVPELTATAAKIRGRLLDVSNRCRIPHLGSSLSCVDIMTAVYWSAMDIDPGRPSDPGRDMFLLSKGHAASALYAVLAEYGFIDDAVLETQGEPGSPLEEHPALDCIPGVEAATGSLGHALSIANGMLLAGRIRKLDYKVFVVLGDGECNEGSVWEAAMFAASQKLENLTVIVDFNKWQATGRSCEVMALQPLRKKWEAFGWHAVEIDGHDMRELVNALSSAGTCGKPLAVIANTVKGKGVSFMEDDNNWHYRIPTEEDVAKGKQELGLI